MSKYNFDEWTDRDFSEVKPGKVVQHFTTMRYALVIEEPDHERVRVRLSDASEVWWKLGDLMWRRSTMAAVVIKP